MTFFNNILDSGIYPESWKIGHILPVYKKKGDKNECKNYRGITLLNTMAKFFTKLLNNRLSNWAEINGKFMEGQAGFRKKYNTIDNILILNLLFEKCKESHDKLYCCFLDLSFAFDTVNRQSLWIKLIDLNVSGKIIGVIKNMYENIKTQVKGTSRQLSEFFRCMTGVRQGESLSPVLFCLYINDVEEYLKS